MLQAWQFHVQTIVIEALGLAGRGRGHGPRRWRAVAPGSVAETIPRRAVRTSFVSTARPAGSVGLLRPQDFVVAGVSISVKDF